MYVSFTFYDTASYILIFTKTEIFSTVHNFAMLLENDIQQYVELKYIWHKTLNIT